MIKHLRPGADGHKRMNTAGIIHNIKEMNKSSECNIKVEIAIVFTKETTIKMWKSQNRGMGCVELYHWVSLLC